MNTYVPLGGGSSATATTSGGSISGWTSGGTYASTATGGAETAPQHVRVRYLIRALP